MDLGLFGFQRVCAFSILLLHCPCLALSSRNIMQAPYVCNLKYSSSYDKIVRIGEMNFSNKFCLVFCNLLYYLIKYLI